MTINVIPEPETPAETRFLAGATPADREGGVDVIDLATRFLLLWRTFLICTVISLILSVGYVFRLTPLFEADASILPEVKDDSSNNVAAYFSGRVPGEVFVGLLASRSVQDYVIAHTDLMQLDHTTDSALERGKLASSTIITQGRGNLILIHVRDKNAQRATNIANGYIEALEAQRTKLMVHDGEIRTAFFEQQLNHEADALAAAEQDLEKTQERSGVVQPEAQTNIGLNAVASLRAQITSLQVKLSGMLQSESEQNPEVKEVRAQLNQLQGQEQAAESATSGAGTKASIRQMPELNLENSRKQRLVKYHATLFDSLSNQLEADRLTAGFSGNPFAVIDRAVVPESRVWPNRRMLYLFALSLSVFLGIAAVALQLVWRKIVSQPEHAERVRLLRNSFRIFR